MKSDVEWKSWGLKDPLFAVATWKGKQKGSLSAWTEEDFLKVGESDMADVLSRWRSYGIQQGSCIEIGCGSGRMTKPLSKAFDSVVALDVSQGQIDTAKRLVGDAKSVTFHLVSAPAIPVADETCTAMFSCHVFQHFSSFGAINSYLKDSYRALRPGGSICFHLPTWGSHRRHRPIVYLRNLKTKVLRSLGFKNIMEFHIYPVIDVLDAMGNAGFSDLQHCIFPMKSNGDYHSFFFGRK